VRGSSYKFPRLRAKKITFIDYDHDASELFAPDLPFISRLFSHCDSLDGLGTEPAENPNSFIATLEGIGNGTSCNAGSLLKVKLLGMHRGYEGWMLDGSAIDSVVNFLREMPEADIHYYRCNSVYGERL